MSNPSTNPRWLYTTRESFEIDLVEELALENLLAKTAQPSLVLSSGASARPPAFGRQGFPISIEAEGARLIDDVLEGLRREYQTLCGAKRRPFTLQVFVPDADATNTLATKATDLEDRLRQALCSDPTLARRHIEDPERGRDLDGVLLQVCLTAPEHAYAGATLCTEAISLFPGGRARLRLRPEMPSRAALKVEEAFHWLRRAPDAGDLCVDLGAAPGGWSYILLERRARVFAVDPAKLTPELMKRRGLRHFCQSAFQFEPPEPALWLFCDMAWRPLEVGQLLAKWGRRRWASFLVANIKLPMKKKAAFIKEVEKTIAGGWQDVHARQLYHDREEVTFGAWRT